MKRNITACLVLALSLLIAFTVLAVTGNANQDSSALHQKSHLSATGSATTALASQTEYWRLGITSEHGATSTATQGRLLQAVASFRSYRDMADQYFIFPAPGEEMTIQAANYHVIDRSGTYPGAAVLTLEIIDFAGTVQHTVSAVAIDMQAAQIGTWASVALSSASEELVIVPGEFLAFHFGLDGAPAGNLGVYPLFEVQVSGTDVPSAPETPALLEPPNGTVTSTHNVTLVWTESVGATGYNVRLDSSDVVTTTQPTMDVFLPTGIHTWTVRAFNSAGVSLWAAPWTVEVTTREIFLPLVVRDFRP